MCLWSSQITSDCADCFLNPSRLLSPPPPLQLLPFLILIAISFVTRRMVIQGCFKTTSFDTNYWHLFLRLTLFAFLSLHCSFPVHFSQHTLPKKCTLFSAGQLSLESLFPLFPLLQFFIFLNEPCQLFISKELNHPVNPIMLYPWFYEGKGRHCA